MRNVDELQKILAELQATGEKLMAVENPTDEQSGELATTADAIVATEGELANARSREKIIAVKERSKLPTSPAPRIQVSQPVQSQANLSEGLGLFLRSKTADADNTPEAHYKCRSMGINLSNNSLKLPVNYQGLNFKYRTIMSKVAANAGADLVWQSYSDKVTEYLTFASPLIGFLSSETTSDGNKRTYFKLDDTAMISTYTTASSGTEINPTVPETNMATDNVVIGCVDITSGYQKISFNALRDLYINLADKIAKANANSHARKIEYDVVRAAGDGETGVQGLESVAYNEGTAEVSVEALEALYFSVPAQYRANAVFLCNPETYAAVFSVLKNAVSGESLFGKYVQDNIEFDILFAKKFIVSTAVSANKILFFNPEHYQLRLVEGQLFQQFQERFWPNAAWAGIMSFGGAWLGPTGANGSIKYITITEASSG